MSDAENDRRARGEAMFNEVYGGIVPLQPRDQRGAFLNNTVDHLFGEIWTRDGLSIRDRRLMILGVAMALGESGIVEIQLKAALAKGELTPEQIEEILPFIVNYIGYPRASSLGAILQRVLADNRQK